MVILTEKHCLPPPSYQSATQLSPPPFPKHRGPLNISVLPSHLLLQIVYCTFTLPQPEKDEDEGLIEKKRRTLYWMSVGLRLVNRAFYLASMHVLRSTYLPSYTSLIRPPYTTDPFPTDVPSYKSSQANASTTSLTNRPASPLQTLHRETRILDLFIALKVREDVWLDESELHLEREEAYKDLFDLNQPRARLEDLVRHYGIREGVVYTHKPRYTSSPQTPTTPSIPAPNPKKTPSRGSSFFSSFTKGSSTPSKPTTPSPTPTPQVGIHPILFSSLSVTFSSRKIGLQLLSQGRKRTIVEVVRGSRDEKLEKTAKALVEELKGWLEQ